jgi:hypothetical protein
MQIGAKTALWVLWQLNYVRDVPIIGKLEKAIAGKILSIFLPLKESVTFSDIWYSVLPMDNSIDDSLMPTCFAELWFDLDKAAGKCRVDCLVCAPPNFTPRCGVYIKSIAPE